MKMEDFQLCKDDEGMEFVQFTEGPTKTGQGGLQSKNRDFQPRMFSVRGERCPVALFKQFVEPRPLNMRRSGPFYLSIKTNQRLKDNIWFKTQPMGVNTISNMMKTTVPGTSLEESQLKNTKHPLPVDLHGCRDAEEGLGLMLRNFNQIIERRHFRGNLNIDNMEHLVSILAHCS